jgi:hypothetical protein
MALGFQNRGKMGLRSRNHSSSQGNVPALDQISPQASAAAALTYSADIFHMLSGMTQHILQIAASL